jgi:hypothetical protein
LKKEFTFALAGVAVLSALLSTQRLTARSPQEDLIQGFRTVEVASVSDAMEQLYGKKLYMSHDMRPLFPNKFAGPAVTVQLRKEENTDGPKAACRKRLRDWFCMMMTPRSHHIAKMVRNWRRMG